MGRGIAQLFAQAAVPTVLFDSQPTALAAAIQSIQQTWASLREKGRLSAERVDQARALLQPASSLVDLEGCDLVIEAISEDIAAKQQLLVSLEAIVPAHAVLASNTSSLSITALAAALRHPERVAGFHFFNPVPLMRIVEVVAGARTSPELPARLVRFAQAAGHRAVICSDTPGFIVNHAGRGYGTEALRILAERVAPLHVIDRILREQVNFEGQGFRLGPFELLDLTGLDVSHPVMESIYHQYYQEPRFRPSVITAQRKAAGLFGRKASAGFYTYVDGRKIEPAWPSVEPLNGPERRLQSADRGVGAVSESAPESAPGSAAESAPGSAPESAPGSAPESAPDRAPQPAPELSAAAAEEPNLSDLRVWIAPLPPEHPDSVLAELVDYLAQAGVAVSGAGASEPAHASNPAASAAQQSTGGVPPSNALIVLCPLGEDASAMAARLGLDATRAIALDTLFAFGWRRCKLRSLMSTVTTSAVMQRVACRLFSLDGASIALLNDSPGFVTQRVLAMIVAIACDMAQQAVGSPQDIDDAVRIGLGYPAGPLSIGDALGPARIHAVLKAMHACTGDPRYRPSVWLRRRADLRLALRGAT